MALVGRLDELRIPADGTARESESVGEEGGWPS